MEKKEMWSMMKLLEYQRGGTDSEWYQELQAQMTPEEYRNFSQEAEQEQLWNQNPLDNYPYPLKSR